MKVKIQDYRGYSIAFDTEKETFITEIDDRYAEKKSFASAKKYIDDFIKDNSEFKPFLVERFSDGWGSEEKTMQIIGIRKDGRFVALVNGKKDQVSAWDEEYYILRKSKNAEIKEEYEKLKKEFKALEEKQKALIKKVDAVTLKEYKKQLQGE